MSLVDRLVPPPDGTHRRGDAGVAGPGPKRGVRQCERNDEEEHRPVRDVLADGQREKLRYRDDRAHDSEVKYEVEADPEAQLTGIARQAGVWDVVEV